MTDLPAQTLLIDCREDSLANHRHTPKKKNTYKREQSIKIKKREREREKKCTNPLVKIVLHSRTDTNQLQTRVRLTTHGTDCYIAKWTWQNNKNIHSAFSSRSRGPGREEKNTWKRGVFNGIGCEREMSWLQFTEQLSFSSRTRFPQVRFGSEWGIVFKTI